MDEWCTKQHGSVCPSSFLSGKRASYTNLRQSGLTKACLDSQNSREEVENAVLEYIQKYIPEKFVGVLAGSSVHCDRMFLAEYMPKLVEHLHYRYVSVTLGHISFSGFIIVVQDRWYEILPSIDGRA